MAENTLYPNISQSGGASPCGQAEQALDGVRYARILNGNVLWRLGVVNTAWRGALVPLGAEPDADALSALEESGIWLSPDDGVEPLAVMCGGMGALWPGVGRGLYDAFPAARAAMDRIQSVAHWDVLSLMDEKDPEKINATRWQIPYLFLLEYAQWSCLAELGLSPGLLFGHSLGELMALCFAGIYAPDLGWYILDTHAMHVAELEARASTRTAMMSVHAEHSVIEEVRAAWPDIVVVNYNTRTQFIVSGPRDALGEVRASLRKRRIPAIMLPVSLMFHSPGMRVLRDPSIRGLGVLELTAPRVPVLSMATTGFYPDDAAGISRLIADLDENPVRWLENVENAWTKHGMRHFLELGPRDVLCGLVRDIQPKALCLACDRKDREIEGMREACARLYALGHLSWNGIVRRARSAPQGIAAESPAAWAQAAVPAAPPPSESLSADDDPAMRTVAELLSRASGRPAGTIGPNTDLRYDLALRSSSFPLLVSEAEEAFGVSVPFETLLGVVTAGDLARVLSGRGKDVLEKTAAVDGPKDEAALRFAPPLLRFAVQAGGAVPLPFDPAGKGLLADAGGTLAVCCGDAAFVRDFLGGLAPLALHLSVPEPLAPWRPSAETTRLVPLDAAPAAEDDAIAACARGAVCLLFAAARDCADPDRAAQLLRLCVAGAGAGLRSVLVVRRFSAHAAENGAASVFGDDALVHELENVARERRLASRCVDVCVGAGLRPLNEYADMLARELLRGGGARGARHVLWAPAGAAVVRDASESLAAVPCVVTRDELFPLVFPDPQGAETDGCRRFRGACHFSRFADPALARHGESVADLPYASAFQALAEGALTLAPWLTVTGMVDVRFHPMPEIPIGAVRECSVDTVARPWLLHEGVMKRLFRARLTARALSVEGRRLDAFDPVMEATVLAAARESSPSPLWDAGAWGDSAAANRRSILDVDARYAALGLGDPWRLLAALSVLPGNTPGRDAFVGRLSPQAYLLARNCGKCYGYPLRMLEAVIQAASFVVAAEAERCGEGPAGGHFPAAGWRLTAAGTILFTPAPSLCGDERLQMRRSWKDEALQRFDAQVL
ncbi:MAG: acyltransferase domain-containing protein, partial [Desulfovibrio sp.]|nr:acyltransferase domain-containing protein [Desulfovibrio sp.]